MALPERYHFSRRFNKCAATEVPFQDGQEIWTAIYIGLEDGTYLRKDFSLEGWDTRAEEDLHPFSSWKSRWKKLETEEKAPPLEKDTAETLLEKLTREECPSTENTRYILALILERSRLLIEIESQPLPEGVLRVYKHKKTEAIYLIKDPNLPLDKITELQAEVATML